jgi:hypothetical protein
MNDDHIWRSLVIGLCGLGARFLVAFALEVTERTLKAWKDKKTQKECDK